MGTKKESIVPISWDSWDDLGENVIALYNATFTEKFGVFDKDEYYECSLSIDYSNGIISAYNENGNLIKNQKFIAIPFN